MCFCTSLANIMAFCDQACLKPVEVYPQNLGSSTSLSSTFLLMSQAAASVSETSARAECKYSLARVYFCPLSVSEKLAALFGSGQVPRNVEYWLSSSKQLPDPTMKLLSHSVSNMSSDFPLPSYLKLSRGRRPAIDLTISFNLSTMTSYLHARPKYKELPWAGVGDPAVQSPDWPCNILTLRTV